MAEPEPADRVACRATIPHPADQVWVRSDGGAVCGICHPNPDKLITAKRSG